MTGQEGLWELVWGRPQVDPAALAEAIEREAAHSPLDYRTRVLIRDASEALEAHWGGERWRDWLERSPAAAAIQLIRTASLGEVGFPLLRGALMDRLDPDVVRQYLLELGSAVSQPVELAIGGAIALILPGLLSRSTQDVGVVDEVPVELRSQHALLGGLAKRYGLHLTPFQSHFLPAGWQSRTHTDEGPFGRLRVALVDAGDIFLGKLFSAREKDRDDLRELLLGLDRDALVRRLQGACAGLLSDPLLRANAERNWYILTGLGLPAPSPPPQGGNSPPQSP